MSFPGDFSIQPIHWWKDGHVDCEMDWYIFSVINGLYMEKIDASFHCGTNPGVSVLTTFQGDDLIRRDNLRCPSGWWKVIADIPKCWRNPLFHGAPQSWGTRFHPWFSQWSEKYTNKELGLFSGSSTSGNLHKYGGQIPLLSQKSPILQWINSPFWWQNPIFLYFSYLNSIFGSIKSCLIWRCSPSHDLWDSHCETRGADVAEVVGVTGTSWNEWLMGEF